MLGETLLTWGVSAGSAGVGIGVGIWATKLLGNAVKWTVEYFTGRLDKKEADLDEQEGRLNQRLEAQIKRLTERLDRVETDLDECKRLHAEERARRLELEAFVNAQGQARQQAALIVAAEKRDSKRGHE